MDALTTQAVSKIIDVAKIDVNISLDAIDIALLVTTGGIGYLARQAYLNYDRTASISTQTENIRALIDEAKRTGSSAIAFRVHRDVPICVPSDAEMEEINCEGKLREVVIRFL